MGGFHRDLNKEMGCVRKCSVEKGLVIRLSVIRIRAGHMLWPPGGQFADPCFSTTVLALVTHSHPCWQAWRDQYHSGPRSWNTSVIQIQHKAIGDKVHPQNASISPLLQNPYFPSYWMTPICTASPTSGTWQDSFFSLCLIANCSP